MNAASEAHVKLRSLLLTALSRVPSTAINSRPNRSSCRHSRTNSRKTGLKAARLSRRKSAMVLKSGLDAALDDNADGRLNRVRHEVQSPGSVVGRDAIMPRTSPLQR